MKTIIQYTLKNPGNDKIEHKAMCLSTKTSPQLEFFAGKYLAFSVVDLAKELLMRDGRKSNIFFHQIPRTQREVVEHLTKEKVYMKDKKGSFPKFPLNENTIMIEGGMYYKVSVSKLPYDEFEVTYNPGEIVPLCWIDNEATYACQEAVESGAALFRENGECVR